MPNTPESRIVAVETRLAKAWQALETRCHQNVARVMTAFLDQGLSDSHFASVTGYAHHDTGRAVTDAIFAQVFQAEAALVRLQFVSGTHAIACALRGCLKPGETLLTLTGKPYDTLEPLLGKRGESPMALPSQGIHYAEIDLLNTSTLRLAFSETEAGLIRQAAVGFIQRSRGYHSHRPSLGIADLDRLIRAVRALNPHIVIVVDNCYGEFVETCEPPAVGADLIAGSLIKNPGGGIVPTGGYIAGKQRWVDAAAEVLTCPGIGSEGGYTFEATRTILQGLALAPMVVKESLKGMRLLAGVFEAAGDPVSPGTEETQADILQVIELGSPERVLAFCQALQSVSPVDARLTPIPAVTPGYADPVVMAGGTFIFGSTIELSADAPMRPPYAVYVQGGLSYSHVRFAVQNILARVFSG